MTALCAREFKMCTSVTKGLATWAPLKTHSHLMHQQINAPHPPPPPHLHLDDDVLQIKWKFYPDLNRKDFNQFKPVYC